MKLGPGTGSIELCWWGWRGRRRGKEVGVCGEEKPTHMKFLEQRNDQEDGVDLPF